MTTKTTREITLPTEPFAVNIGPAHPSTHGVFRMLTTLDGEVIVNMEPIFGYLHRGIEKLAEERTYGGCVPLTDRLDYLASMSNNLAYCPGGGKAGRDCRPRAGGIHPGDYG